MRRVAIEQDSERGAAAVLVAMLMVVLLGFGAIAVDIGLLYSEKAQLQNGADAGALGIAQACAKDATSINCTGHASFAKGMADKNSLDNLSNIQSVNLDLATRTVAVTADPLEAGRTDNRVSLHFANIFGISASSVVAKSSVIWGSPSKGTTPFPLTISRCQVESRVDGAKQLIRSHSATVTDDCPATSSGGDTPGGFGWIVQDPGGCGGYIDLLVNESGSDTGNDGPSNCDTVLNGWAAEIMAGKEVVILLPVFLSVSGTGTGTTYDVNAFAAFKVEGWKFGGTSGTPMTFRNRAEHHPDNPALECRGDCRGIIGKFIKYTALSSGYEELGPVSPYGATVVKLIN